MLMTQCQQNENNDKIKAFLVFSQEKGKLRGTQLVSLSKNTEKPVPNNEGYSHAEWRGAGKFSKASL